MGDLINGARIPVPIRRSLFLLISFLFSSSSAISRLLKGFAP